jgi:putative membrane protein
MTRLFISKIETLIHADQFKISILYLVMLSGGIIQYLQVFRAEMEILATFVICGISILIYIEYYWYIRKAILSEAEKKAQIKKFSVWLGLVFFLSMVVENIGVVTGAVFGKYTYGPVLVPFIGDVPLAIGFAWINTLVPAMMIISRIIKPRNEFYKWLSAAMIGLLMVAFDIVLEQAAVELNYWHWENNSVPLQNYLAWYILGFIFARIGYYLHVERTSLPPIFQHIYFAQIGYFFLVIIR